LISTLGSVGFAVMLAGAGCSHASKPIDSAKPALDSPDTSAASGTRARSEESRTASQARGEDLSPQASAAPPAPQLERAPEPSAAVDAKGAARPAATSVNKAPAQRGAAIGEAYGAGGLGLSGIGEGGGGRADGRGFGSGHGRLSGAHATVAPKIVAQGRPQIVAQAPLPPAEFNTEAYSHINENPFLAVADQPLSTFSIDVDTASYSNARRFLNDGQAPPKDAIRVEEWINYFAYDYPDPAQNEPFSVTSEVSSCPWNAAHRLVRIGLKSKAISQEATPARNLVFLIDVSGSMMPENRLPLLKRGLAMLARNLRKQDTLTMVVYAGASGLALPATSGVQQARILDALGRLEAGGSTNGGDGIRLAYKAARDHFIQGGINRVILATDGDFNVGTTSQGELERLIEEERKSGVFLTVLGFGEGNLKDATMEGLADKGNGNYAYIDSLSEARKVLVREAGSTLITIAKDVKLQVEFNPTRVASYKLVGYEDRLLAKEDFNNDKKDAGDIGAGHNVTALYELIPQGVPAAAPQSDALKYQAAGALAPAASSNELMTVNVRYKPPHSDTSTKFTRVVVDNATPLDKSSNDFRFGAAVAEAALVLRGAPDMHGASLDSARAMAASALGSDVSGDRHEFVSLLAKAKAIVH
jgi:Ca-activated chloride channel family protein